MSEQSALTRGRQAVIDGAWRDASDHLAAADAQRPLDCADLEQLALARFLIGQEEASIDTWTRCYQRHLKAHEQSAAARCAFWAGFQLQLVGEMAQAGGWLGRVNQALDDCRGDCVERGYVLLPPAIQLVEDGDAEHSLPLFTQAVEIGAEFSDANLVALGNLGLAQVHILTGDVARGLQLLDEVMLSITAGEVKPHITGLIYCATIIACQEVFDIRRAHEWTRALSRWCEQQQDLAPFRGQCLVHRAELMQMKGEWPDALLEVQLARERLSEPPGQPAIGMAYYEEGELHRLRGELAQAEAAFRQAHQFGHEPHPGLAMLWLQQGKTDVAVATITRCLEQAVGLTKRTKLLPAAVELFLAAGLLDDARACSGELAAITKKLDAPVLRAGVDQQSGAVELAADNPSGALALLRSAWQGWQTLDAPYEAARVRVLLGQALRSLGEEDMARMEFDAARVSFQRLGAAADLMSVERLIGGASPDDALPLTVRERQILQLLATGATNKSIAVDLVISEKTVARHVANIYAKLDVSSRSAATAYAYEHGLVGRT